MNKFFKVLSSVVIFYFFLQSEALTYEYDVKGIYRFRFTQMRGFFLNDEGDKMSRSTFGSNRLSLKGKFVFSKLVELEMEMYLLEGLNFGDRLEYGREFWEDIRDKREILLITPRKFFITLKTPVGVIEAGNMLSSWGLGIIANDGEGKSNLWSDAYYGDIVERVVFITKPFLRSGISPLRDRFIAGLGADFVLRDEYGGLIKGDIPVEAILFLLYQEKNLYSFGLYTAYRYQRFEGGEYLSAGAYDFYGKVNIPLHNNINFFSEGEIAILEGKTDLIASLGAMKGVHILAGGGALRTGFSTSSPRLKIIFEGGGASGDADLFDKSLRIFTFDPDYKVGLIGYEEVMAGLTAGSAQRISNPELVGTPPPGTDALATKGGVRNSLYLNFYAEWKPLSNFLLKGGFVNIWLLAPLMDPYLSTQNGGIPVNPFGTPYPGKHLGYEFDLGGELKFSLGRGLFLRTGLEGGIFFKGSSLESFADYRFPPNVYKILMRLNFEWKGERDEKI